MIIKRYQRIRSIAYPFDKREYGNKLIFSIICRSFSTTISIIFYKIGISPNFVSILSIFIGCLGIYNLFIADFAIGSIMVSLCKFLDCVDGELARIKNKFSNKSSLLEPLNSDLQYLFLLPAISSGLYLINKIDLLYFILSVISSGCYVIIRKIWNIKAWKGEKNLSWFQRILYCQFKPSGKLRSVNKLGANLYYLKYNLIAQNGIMYPSLVILSFYNFEILPYYVYFFIILYFSFFSLTLFGFLLIKIP
tara:strand:+ start:725 stop:1474 length:750 start_codon:yes stop_codon:yes gene_type:complete